MRRSLASGFVAVFLVEEGLDFLVGKAFDFGEEGLVFLRVECAEAAGFDGAGEVVEGEGPGVDVVHGEFHLEFLADSHEEKNG
jgi:hypothetical protein